MKFSEMLKGMLIKFNKAGSEIFVLYMMIAKKSKKALKDFSCLSFVLFFCDSFLLKKVLSFQSVIWIRFA